MQRFWVQSFPDPGRRRTKWRPADRVGYETTHKLRKLLVSKSVEAPPTCRAGALLTECRRRTSVVPATVPVRRPPAHSAPRACPA